MPVAEACDIVGEPTLAEFLATLRSRSLDSSGLAADAKLLRNWKARPKTDGLVANVEGHPGKWLAA